MKIDAPAGIRIVALSGSVRPGNYTGKALALVMEELAAHQDVFARLLDPAALDLPLPGREPDNPLLLREFRDTVASATGVILATPEYHGSFSSVMKLAIDNLGFPSALGGKPVALLGVAAGQIGAVKAAEHLRSVCSHVGALVLPGTVSVANVQQLFDEQGRCLDPKIERRIRGVATNLLDYIHGHICPKVTLEHMAREAEAAGTPR
jgi:NAD(P)H-dependent FMN reductase